MSESVLDIAKLRLEAIESEANELRNFIRMYIKLDGAKTMPAPMKYAGGGMPALAGWKRIGVPPSAISSADVSPKEEIIDVVRHVLKQVHPRPLLIGDLFEAVLARGVNIGGQNPKGNLSAKLAPVPDIVYIKDEGWYYRPQKEEAPDGNPGRNTSEASLFAVDPEAQGVKAAPGGGP